MVQSRFGHFVLMLWTVFKLDLVAKTVTRDFIETIDKPSDHSMRDLCDLFVQDKKNITNLSTAILHAMQHVHVSLYNALVT